MDITNVGEAGCEGLNVCVPHPNSYVEILTPNVMVLGGAFGRRLDHEGRGLISGIGALMKKTSFTPFCHLRLQGKDGYL